MKGSHINVWLTKGAKVKLEDSQSPAGSSFGWENPAFSPRDSNELCSLGLVPIEDKVDELLERHQISFVVRSQPRSESGQQGKVLLQLFVAESQVEAVMVGLERCGVGAVAGTGYSLIPTAGRSHLPPFIIYILQRNHNFAYGVRKQGNISPKHP